MYMYVCTGDAKTQRSATPSREYARVYDGAVKKGVERGRRAMPVARVIKAQEREKRWSVSMSICADVHE